jgi:hypothetical protein
MAETETAPAPVLIDAMEEEMARVEQCFRRQLLPGCGLADYPDPYYCCAETMKA